MIRIPWPSVVIVILRSVITLVFVGAIVPKFQHPAMWAHLFTTWGYPSWGPPVISAVEIVGLVVLWIPTLAKWGSAVLMITTAGATGTWLLNGPRIAATLPGGLLIFLVTLAWLQRARSPNAARPAFERTH